MHEHDPVHQVDIVLEVKENAYGAGVREETKWRSHAPSQSALLSRAYLPPASFFSLYIP